MVGAEQKKTDYSHAIFYLVQRQKQTKKIAFNLTSEPIISDLQ